MKLNKPGLELIKRWEGFKSCPYLDPVKIPTVGIGTTVYPNGELVKIGDPCIDIKKAYEYLEHHVNKSVLKYLPSLIKVQLNDNQVDALISLVYNIGITNFKKSSLLKLINSGVTDKEKLTASFLLWVKAKGITLAGLVSRRKEEAKLYFS